MINIKKFSLMGIVLAMFLAIPNLEAADEVGISNQQLNEIQARVNNMSFEQLNERRSQLLSEQAMLQEEAASSPGAGASASVRSRLAAISAELSTIQKALLAIAGLGAVSALTNDPYNDNVPPVITVIGSNPATVELGDTYTDAGATAFDEFHGETPVTSSGSVDTSVVGSNIITYTATDKDGNTATATRTVNVEDTTAPVVTVTGDNPVTHELGTTYTDAGATATDASGSVTVVTSGEVDSDTLGS